MSTGDSEDETSVFLLSWGSSFGGGVLPQVWLGRGFLDKVAGRGLEDPDRGHGLCRGGGKKVRGQMKAWGRGGRWRGDE